MFAELQRVAEEETWELFWYLQQQYPQVPADQVKLAIAEALEVAVEPMPMDVTRRPVEVQGLPVSRRRNATA